MKTTIYRGVLMVLGVATLFMNSVPLRASETDELIAFVCWIDHKIYHRKNEQAYKMRELC